MAGCTAKGRGLATEAIWPLAFLRFQHAVNKGREHRRIRKTRRRLARGRPPSSPSWPSGNHVRTRPFAVAS